MRSHTSLSPRSGKSPVQEADEDLSDGRKHSPEQSLEFSNCLGFLGFAPPPPKLRWWQWLSFWI